MNQSLSRTDFLSLLPDLDGGVLEQQIGQILSEVALGVVNTDKRKGEVVLKLEFQRVGDSSQVLCVHTLSYSRPTHRGRVREDKKTETPLHVLAGGRLALMPLTRNNELFPVANADAIGIKDLDQ